MERLKKLAENFKNISSVASVQKELFDFCEEYENELREMQILLDGEDDLKEQAKIVEENLKISENENKRLADEVDKLRELIDKLQNPEGKTKSPTPKPVKQP